MRMKERMSVIINEGLILDQIECILVTINNEDCFSPIWFTKLVLKRF